MESKEVREIKVYVDEAISKGVGKLNDTFTGYLKSIDERFKNLEQLNNRDDLMDSSQVVRFLGISRSTLNRHMKNGLQYEKAQGKKNGKIYFKKSVVSSFLRSLQLNA